MSRGSASSCSAASSLARSTSSSAAGAAAAPPICVDLEPYVPAPRATRSVSPLITVTRSTGSPSCSATICANVVSWPWPCENEPVLTIASPSGVISTAPNSTLTDPVGDLDVGRHADPQQRRVAELATARLLGAQLVIARGLERRVEHQPVVAAVVGRRRSTVVYGNSSAPMKFARRTSAGSSPSLGGERVDGALQDLRRLGTAGATQRRGRAGVGHHRVKSDLDPRDPVHAGPPSAASASAGSRRPRVGA